MQEFVLFFEKDYIHSRHTFYTTAGCDGRDKSQLCFRQRRMCGCWNCACWWVWRWPPRASFQARSLPRVPPAAALPPPGAAKVPNFCNIRRKLRKCHHMCVAFCSTKHAGKCSPRHFYRLEWVCSFVWGRWPPPDMRIRVEEKGGRRAWPEGAKGGKGGGARPAAHSGTRTAARQPQRARSRQELQDVDTEQGPRRGVQPPHVLSGHQHRLRHKGRHFYQARFTDFTVGRVNLWHNRQEWLGY